MKNLPLKLRMMFYSTMMVIAVVTSISSVLLYFHKKEVWEEFGLRTESIGRALTRDLELPVLIEDKLDIQRTVEGILSLQDVVSVTVYDAKENLLFRKANNPSFFSTEYQMVVNSHIEIETSKISENTQELHSNGSKEKIGRVETVFSTFKLNTKLMNMIYTVILFTCLVILLRVVIDYLFIRGVVKPLASLVEGSMAVANGDLSHSIEIKSKDEVGKLASSFNQMVKALRERDEKIMASQTQLEGSYMDMARANKELLVAKKAAEEASIVKSEFLANMSHELRTPLTSVRGFAQLLERTELNKQQAIYLEKVVNSSGNLLKLIDEILDLLKVESGRMELDEIDFHLSPVIEKNVESFALRAAQKNLELLIYINPNVPGMLVGDPARLRQVLVNLMDNAVKFTERGEIMVSVSMEEGGNESAVIHFSVHDTGIGIPKNKIGIIFDSFRQVDGSSTRRYGGTGLGTTIAKQLVELMGGKIWVESQELVGTTFHYVIPFKLPPNSKVKAANKVANTFQGFRALIVDDNETSCKFFHRLLSYWGVDPAISPSCEKTVDLLIDAEKSGYPFDIFIIDFHMPGMSGLEVASKIISAQAPYCKKIIMVNNLAAPEEVKKSMELGITNIIAKPIKQEELYKAIKKITKEENYIDPIEKRGIPAGKTTSPPPTLNILLAEDDPGNQELIMIALETEGFNVMVAENGERAFKLWEKKKIDLILMDIQMPVMDGYEAIKAIRDKEKITHGHTPIIALTAFAMKGDLQKCLKAGADDYISKPVELVKLVQRIKAMPLIRERSTEG